MAMPRYLPSGSRAVAIFADTPAGALLRAAPDEDVEEQAAGGDDGNQKRHQAPALLQRKAVADRDRLQSDDRAEDGEGDDGGEDGIFDDGGGIELVRRS